MEATILVLSRKKNEQIIVGEGKSQVVITIVEVRGDRVRLGIEAMKEIEIHRKEVFDAIQEQNRKANEQ